MLIEFFFIFKIQKASARQIIHYIYSFMLHIGDTIEIDSQLLFLGLYSLL